MTITRDCSKPTRSTPWQLWSLDLFDRESAPEMLAVGHSFVDGLGQLWLRTIVEGIDDGGNASFSCFYLVWAEGARSRVEVDVQPFANSALLALRLWLQGFSGTPALNGQANPIIDKLASLHFDYLLCSDRWFRSSVNTRLESSILLRHVEKASGAADFLFQGCPDEAL